LWELVWNGIVTNDTLHPVRNLIRRTDKRSRITGADGQPGSVEFLRRLRARSGENAPAQGRWSLLRQRITSELTPTEWSANIAQQMLVRNGIVMRETAASENLQGGYSTVYPALKKMEDAGWVRRGMFVAGMGAAQFAMSAAVDMLRGFRTNPDSPESIYLAASDPANPYGSLLPWPRLEENSADPNALQSLARAAGAGVILVNGQIAAYLRRRNPAIRIFLPENEPERTQFAREVATRLANLAIRRQGRKQGLLVATINDQTAKDHFMARFLEDAGFVNTALGYHMRRVATAVVSEPEDETEEANETV
jgi:ATP-dependent Lhr-like helicase